MDRYIVVSSDGHAGPPAELYRDYLDPEFRVALRRAPGDGERLPGLHGDRELEAVRGGVGGGDGRRRGPHAPATTPPPATQILDTEGVCAEVLFPDADVLGTGRLASSPFGTGLAAGSQSDPADAVAGEPRPQPLARRLRERGADPPHRHRGDPGDHPRHGPGARAGPRGQGPGPHAASSSPPAGSTGPPTTSPTTTRCSRSSRSWASCSTPTPAPVPPTTAWATGCSRSTPARPAGGRPARCTS